MLSFNIHIYDFKKPHPGGHGSMYDWNIGMAIVLKYC